MKNNKRFDIVKLYPSITKTHYINALEQITPLIILTLVSPIHKYIIHSCDSFLFSKENVWKKRDTDSYFQIPMGSFHGAEVSNLQG